MINTFDYNGKISIMGIINLTPDSFYDGGKWNVQSEIQSKIEKWIELGIDIIDVGCESSRPGALPISINEELNRLKIIIPIIKMFSKTVFSIDTSKPEIAEFALRNGFKMINDIYGGFNGDMFEIASKFKCPIIIMHMLGKPENMQDSPRYNNIMDNLDSYFYSKIELARKFGLTKNQIILDPGIGFGKRILDNDKILNNINSLKKHGCPILLGTSRKSFLKVEDGPENRLSNSISTFTIGILNGANILRVHDVEESIKVKVFLERYTTNNNINHKLEIN